MLFKKAACFTDIHFGRKGNDLQCNRDNEEFVDWFIDTAKVWGAETFIFLGDWHDNRATIGVATLNFSLRCMEKLSQAFEKVYFIPGNHDNFYREKRDLNSVAFGRNLGNVHIVNEPTTLGDVTILPWLVGDEWKKLKHLKSRYVFGHLELPGYMMNAKVEMPDHGGLKSEHFVNQEYVFSGHFHMRQAKDKCVYVGNVFPFNFSDAWDADRGCMLLEWGKQPQFVAWQDQPLYRTAKLSELLHAPQNFLCEKMTARVSLDIDISFEEAQFIRDELCRQYGARKIDLVALPKEESEQEFDPNVRFQSVDQIVIEGLASVESIGINGNLMIDIYRGLS